MTKITTSSNNKTGRNMTRNTTNSNNKTSNTTNSYNKTSNTTNSNNKTSNTINSNNKTSSTTNSNNMTSSTINNKVQREAAPRPGQTGDDYLLIQWPARSSLITGVNTDLFVELKLVLSCSEDEIVFRSSTFPIRCISFYCICVS
ncbi:hypothetical protein ElyMa_004210800 [Elysia marginata]|uniref:Uncharacterized protein n=1 Tax=Elysia marginata TaxID=1093978 RepID=A0AAV4GMH5_9GAST|nr:hypothetical protein ElyMa_004210800 [Elysia marginata]